MNVAEEARNALRNGLLEIIQQFELPQTFPPEVTAQTESLVELSQSPAPAWMENRRDLTHLPFVTLDPLRSTDLDQAFYLEKKDELLILHYALADISPFATNGNALEKEAWQRGVTIYGLTEKIPLYPKPISQGLASLLPDGPRPAYLVSVSIDRLGAINLLQMDRVICQSSAKLGYEVVSVNDLPHLEEFAQRMWRNEAARGAIRVEFPQQEIITDETAPGGVRLTLRARNVTESANSTLSLAVNLALGELFKSHKIGIFRVMDEPTNRAMQQLRRTAHALDIDWPRRESLRDLQRRLDPENIIHQRFLLEARRSGGRASYVVFDSAIEPWHAAIGATYVHATAPMRRLQDRYVLELAYQLVNDLPIDDGLLDKISRLPDVMQRYENRANNVDRAVIDLVEAVSVQHRVGEVLQAEVVDAESGIVQTVDSAIRSKAMKLPKRVQDGQFIKVRIVEANPKQRRVVLEAV